MKRRSTDWQESVIRKLTYDRLRLFLTLTPESLSGLTGQETSMLSRRATERHTSHKFGLYGSGTTSVALVPFLRPKNHDISTLHSQVFSAPKKFQKKNQKCRNFFFKNSKKRIFHDISRASGSAAAAQINFLTPSELLSKKIVFDFFLVIVLICLGPKPRRVLTESFSGRIGSGTRVVARATRVWN